MLPPLIFAPLYRHYLWGGRRFESFLGRQLDQAGPYAESWELVDRGEDQSVVRAGPLAGQRLGDLLRRHPAELLGGSRQPTAFPLLFKFLDANKVLSVQVHPDDAAAARRTPPDRGKTEAWYVIDAEPGSRIYAGLREGVDQQALAEAIAAGRCAELLHGFEPAAGDCIFIPAGTVHAIGAGLVVAEIQQSSDVTFRLFDWNRVDADGQPRPLHLDDGLAAARFTGPVSPVSKQPTADPAVSQLVDCDYFGFAEVTPASTWQTTGECCEFLAVLAGEVCLPSQWSLPPLQRGDCLLLPAALDPQLLTCRAAPDDTCRLLRVTIPAA
jgi:mannose-6-phosphate isomerase